MPLDPQFRPFLDQLVEGGFLPISAGDPVEARDRYRRLSQARRGPGFVPEPVDDVADRTIEGPPMSIFSITSSRPARRATVWAKG